MFVLMIKILKNRRKKVDLINLCKDWKFEIVRDLLLFFLLLSVQSVKSWRLFVVVVVLNFFNVNRSGTFYFVWVQLRIYIYTRSKWGTKMMNRSLFVNILYICLVINKKCFFFWGFSSNVLDTCVVNEVKRDRNKLKNKKNYDCSFVEEILGFLWERER